MKIQSLEVWKDFVPKLALDYTLCDKIDSKSHILIWDYKPTREETDVNFDHSLVIFFKDISYVGEKLKDIVIVAGPVERLHLTMP